MTWVKVDDSFPRHPKVLGLPAAVKWSYVEALCYCAQYLTDGKFPSGVIGDREARALVKAGLVDLDEGGLFFIHDYLEYNPSKESVQAKSNANRSAARKRWGDVVQSETNAERMQDVLGVRVGVGSAVDLDSKDKVSPPFDRFWIAYPRHVGKVKARQEFDAIVEHGADPEAVIAAAERYRDDTDRDPAYTAHPSTWLHQGRWLDEPGESAEDRTLALLRSRRNGEGSA